MPIRAQGSTADFQLEVRNGSGDFVDPTNLSLTFKDHLGATVSGFPEVYPGDIVKDAVGRYHLDFPIPSVFTTGSYTAQWDGIIAGSPTQAFESWEIVPQGSMSTGGFDIIINPDDYDAVRGLLGVTTLDVENSDIERTPFGPEAELMVKRRISNWATQINDPDMHQVLRLAVVYQTACLMARSWVRGGTIGLARPLSTGEGRDWAEAADSFCGRYEYWVAIADDSDDDPNDDSLFTIKPLWVSGPTTVRNARRRSALPGDPSTQAWWNYPPFWND